MIESDVKNKTVSPAQFVKESIAELKKVVWPDRQKVVRLTLVVIGVSVATGFLIGGLDYLFTKMFGLIIR